MTELVFYRVRNHSRFQHYKERNPPWIKWHRSALNDYAFSTLPDAAKWLAVGMAMIASQTENHIPGDAVWIAGQIGATEPVDFEPLLAIDFLKECSCEACSKQNASATQAQRKQSVSPSRDRDRGRDREETTKAQNAQAHLAHTDQGGPKKKMTCAYSEEFLRFWKVYPRNEGKKRAFGVWKKLGSNRPSTDELIAAVERQKLSDQWAKDRVIPHGSTWLNGARWEDEMPGSPPVRPASTGSALKWNTPKEKSDD